MGVQRSCDAGDAVSRSILDIFLPKDLLRGVFLYARQGTAFIFLPFPRLGDLLSFTHRSALTR